MYINKSQEINIEHDLLLPCESEHKINLYLGKNKEHCLETLIYMDFSFSANATFVIHCQSLFPFSFFLSFFLSFLCLLFIDFYEKYFMKYI